MPSLILEQHSSCWNFRPLLKVQMSCSCWYHHHLPSSDLTLSSATVTWAMLSLWGMSVSQLPMLECNNVCITFVPLTFQTIGGWSSEAPVYIPTIRHLQGQRLCVDPAIRVSHLFQRLAVNLCWGNAAMLASWSPPLPSFVDGVAWISCILCIICLHLDWSDNDNNSNSNFTEWNKHESSDTDIQLKGLE